MYRLNLIRLGFSRRKPGYEPVLHITDYYDGPLRGIAEFNGQPHLFDTIFDEVLEHSSKLYRLSPVPRDILDLANEHWDKEEIKPVLDSALKTDSEKSFVRTGYFEPVRAGHVSGGWQVRWTDPEVPQRRQKGG